MRLAEYIYASPQIAGAQNDIKTRVAAASRSTNNACEMFNNTAAGLFAAVNFHHFGMRCVACVRVYVFRVESESLPLMANLLTAVIAGASLRISQTKLQSGGSLFQTARRDRTRAFIGFVCFDMPGNRLFARQLLMRAPLVY
jgi:hypothetical protein